MADVHKHVHARPDFSAFDLETYEDRLAAFHMLFETRDENGTALTGDIDTFLPELISYTEDETLTMRFHPEKWMLNGLHYVQGGILTAMIDTVCGPMSDICSGGRSAGTLDMVTTFFRPVTMQDEEITITVRMISSTKRVMHMEAELRNSNGKTAMKAITNIMKKAQ